MTVKIPKKERATGTDNLRMFGKVLAKRQNTYQIQTKHGILVRWYHTRDLAEVSSALAKTLVIPDVRREITLRQAAIQSTTATFLHISCRCKGSCDTKRCSC